MRPRGWVWPDRRATRVLADARYPNGEYNGPRSLPIAPTEPAKPSSGQVWGCLGLIAAVVAWLALSWIAIAAFVIRYWP